MTTVHALHPVPAPSDSPKDIDTPTATRLHPMNQPHTQHVQAPGQKEEDSMKTPTTTSFAEANGKRSLPLSPPPPAHASLAKHVVIEASSDDGRRPVSQRSNRSFESNETHGAEGEQTSPEGDASDGESVDGDTGRPTKKKKGQRFFCTDYPPCNLSFTRSEHLARHIRKHTGERPFKCHCNRRFSRLDNLRQHAQTVHVNEEIPTDSLAATGTRFQRQIRTDRVRPAGARSRASTTGSATSHGRGHSRNLSTSSIASTASNMSTMSTISSISQDPRMHPHPLMMAAPEHRPAAATPLTIDTHRIGTQYNYGTPASNGPSTPTSTNYSTNPGSPYSSYSTITSPVTSSRYPSYDGGTRHARRLSVPNGPSPYQSSYPAPMSPSSTHHQYTNNNSTVASPTSSVFSSRQDLTPSEAELRRRTWHPSTHSGYSYQRPATSGLSYSQTPDGPQPAFAPQTAAAASQPVTLPGFKDLVNTINRPATPPGQAPVQPGSQESPSRPIATAGSSSDRSAGPPAERVGHRSWDVSLHQNLNRLDLASGTPPREGGWGQQTMSDINHAASSVYAPSSGHLQPPPTVHGQSGQAPQQQQQQQQQQQPLLGPPLHPAPAHAHAPAAAPPPPLHNTTSIPTAAPPHQGPTSVPVLAPASSTSSGSQPMEVEPTSPARNRRQGWYQGPIAPAPHANVAQQHQRISPASSISEGVPTPSNPSFEHHPTIVHANGYVEQARPVLQPHSVLQQHIQNSQHQQHQPAHSGAYAPVAPKPADQPQLSGLDALVAVATSESQTRDDHR